MSLETFLIVLFIGLPVSLFWNYKFASQFTNAYLYRKLAGQSILVVLAFAEYFYFNSLAMGIVFTCFIAWELLQLIIVLSIIGFIAFTKKLDKREYATFALFFTRFKMRTLFKSENPNIYFFKNNGVNIYFDANSDDFKSLSEDYLSRFKNNIKEEKSKSVAFEHFLILNCDDNYLSVSSDDLQLLNVDIFNMDRNHFDVLRMLKI
jgi:hypothetical protein